MSEPRGAAPARGRADLVVGTGGIGTGVLYRLEGRATLGREESRSAERLPGRDFCKLHIILHYLARLLPALGHRVRVLPVGAVGADPEGRELLGLMRAEGMDLGLVRTVRDARTLFSVCFQYPGGEGGNLTERRAASRRVSARDVARAAPALRRCRGRSLVLAAPEVPLAARLALLALGRRCGAFNAASFVAEELPGLRPEHLRRIDLLALNSGEAAALAGVPARRRPAAIARAAARRLARVAPGTRLAVTCGRQGAQVFELPHRERLPALPVRAVSTAGAGDAFLSGMLAGWAAGLPFLGAGGVSCAALGRLLAALSVTSPDTIHFGVTAGTLRAFARRTGQ